MSHCNVHRYRTNGKTPECCLCGHTLDDHEDTTCIACDAEAERLQRKATAQFGKQP